MSELRWCIGIPVVNSIVAEVYHSHLSMMCVTSRKVSVVIPQVKDVFPHGEARQELWRQALKHNCTHMAFLDSDMYVEQPDMFMTLYDVMQQTGAVMTVGHCYRRGYPYTPTWFKRDPETKKTWVVGADKTSPPFTLDSCGLACNLIDIKKLMTCYTDDHNFFFQGIREGTTYAEDAWFCNQITQAAHMIVAVPSVRVGHVGERMVVNDNTFDPLLDLYIKLNPDKKSEAQCLQHPSEQTSNSIPVKPSSGLNLTSSC